MAGFVKGNPCLDKNGYGKQYDRSSHLNSQIAPGMEAVGPAGDRHGA